MTKKIYLFEPPNKPDKSGIFLYGMSDGTSGPKRIHTLVSYTEGRMSDGDKCYGLAKGAIDPGETAIEAAIRETKEETGVDIAKLLGKKAYAQFLRGEAVTNVESKAYPGVRVIRANPKPMERRYVSSHGHQHLSAYYAIEVEGIENLQSSLKRFDARESSELSSVVVSAQSYVAARGLPTHVEMMDILRSGVVPAREGLARAPKKSQRVIENPVLPKILARHSDALLNINAPQGWEKYWNELSEKETLALKEDFKKIKTYFEQRGVVGDAGDKLKIDTKFRPLSFYQEGGEILPVGEIITRSAKLAPDVEMHGRAMWGDYIGEHRRHASPSEKMRSAQVAAFVSFFGNIAPNEITKAGVDAGIQSYRYLQRALELLEREQAAGQDGSWQNRVAKPSVARMMAAHAPRK